MKYFKLMSVLLLSLYLSGCASSRGLILEKKKKPIDLTEESIALIRLSTDNWNATRYKPKASIAYINRVNGKVKKFKLKISKNKWQVLNKVPNDYLLSVQLPPGDYQIREIMGTSGIFPVQGIFSMPVFQEFQLKRNEIVYLGNIEAVVHKRTSKHELRAGPVLPLIDQAVTGFSGGTFKLSITDQYISDIALFKSAYPQLGSKKIVSRVLDAWVEPTKGEMKADPVKEEDDFEGFGQELEDVEDGDSQDEDEGERFELKA